MRRAFLAGALGRGAAALALAVVVGCNVGPAPSGGLTGDVVYIKNDQLYVFTLGGRDEKKLVELPPGAVAKDPVWSPDGQRVVFAMYPPPQRGVPPGTDLYSVRRDGSDLKLIRQHTLAGEMLEAPYFTPDGKSLLFSRFAPIVVNGQYTGDIIEIVRLDFESGNVVSLVKDAIQPTVSPDGAKIAYIRLNPQTSALSLWLANIDGSAPRQLVADDQFVSMYWPRFAPDGSTVTFAGAVIPSVRREGAPPRDLARPAWHGVPTDIYKVRTDGSKYQQVAKLQEDDPTALWSADGQRLLVIGAKAIYTLRPDGQELTRLREPGGVGGGDWRGK